MSTRLLCEVGGPQCDAHRDGAVEPDDKCPYFCDAPGCIEEATSIEHCPGHEALAAAGAPPDEMALASRKADRYGVTLARLLREAVRTVPLEEHATVQIVGINPPGMSAADALNLQRRDDRDLANDPTMDSPARRKSTPSGT